MQKRYIDYGSSVLSSHIRDMHKIMYSSGVFSSGDILTVSGNDSILVKPFSIITPDGILIEETSSTTLQFNLGVTAKHYTVIVSHTLEESTGGSVATISLKGNLFDMGTLTGATVLGWIIYPGSSVVLDSTMVYTPKSLKQSESSKDCPVWQMSAPFTSKWQVLSTHSELSFSNDYADNKAYTKIINSGASPHTAVVVIPVIGGEYPPSIIRISAKADYQAAIVCSVIDEKGVQYTPANNTISNTDWGIFSIKLANYNGLNLFQCFNTWYIRLSFQLSPSKSVSFQSISVSDYNIPKQGGVFSDVEYTFTFTRIASCLSFWDAAAALPPSVAGARYIASSSGNNWTKHKIYEYNGTIWVETTPVVGNICKLTNAAPDEDYVYTNGGWINEIPHHLILV